MGRPARRVYRVDDDSPAIGPAAPLPDDAVPLDAVEAGTLAQATCLDGNHLTLRIRLPRPIEDPATEIQAAANVAAKAAALAGVKALVDKAIFLGVEGAAPTPSSLTANETYNLAMSEREALAQTQRRAMEEQLRQRRAAEEPPRPEPRPVPTSRSARAGAEQRVSLGEWMTGITGAGPWRTTPITTTSSSVFGPLRRRDLAGE